MQLRADQLKPGQKTCGGMEVSEVTTRNGLVYVSWEGQRRYEVQYFPDQTFDMEETTMAQRVNITVESDLSSAEGAETVYFGLDGVEYSIDLTEKEQSALRKALAQYVGAARQVRGKSRSKATSKASGPSAREVREWAKERGIDVPAKGRIPESVKEEYRAANA